MGGAGSGRHAYGRAVTTGEYHRIDLAFMKRNGWLRPGGSGSLRWSRGGEETGSIRYEVVSYGLRLVYRTRDWSDDEWRSVDEVIPFTWTHPHYGGERAWFVCKSCGRRCRIIYGGSLFRCRRCYGLTYETQYEPPWARQITKASNIRQSLDPNCGIEDPFPEKPKGMHWKTYNRLMAQDEIAQNLWAALVMDWLGTTGRMR